MMQQLAARWRICGVVCSSASGSVCTGGLLLEDVSVALEGFPVCYRFTSVKTLTEHVFIAFTSVCFDLLIFMFPWHQSKQCIVAGVDMRDNFPWVSTFNNNNNKKSLECWFELKSDSLLLFSPTCLLDSFGLDHMTFPSFHGPVSVFSVILSIPSSQPWGHYIPTLIKDVLFTWF